MAEDGPAALQAYVFTMMAEPARTLIRKMARRTSHRGSSPLQQPQPLRPAHILVCFLRLRSRIRLPYGQMMFGVKSILQTLRRTSPWTCRSCLQQLQQQRSRQSAFQQSFNYATKANRPRAPRSKRRRRVILAATGGTVLAGAVALNDNAKHAATAVQRTSRVLSTLAVCINE